MSDTIFFHTGTSIMRVVRSVIILSLMLCAGCAHIHEPQVSRVYKYDGSVQCEQSGVPVGTMQNQLMNAGVDVICGRKARDGKAYPAMCGAATGRINVYTIDESDLDTAGRLGFKSVETLTDARIPPCE